ncbi:MAG: PAS domain S-box protein [Haloferacaceae archaeon]
MEEGASVDVLHVDDDADFADMTATFLERQDDRLSVRTAPGGEEALAMLHERGAGDGTGFDAVVSDYQMPGMDGLDLLGAVRERYPDLPFILYTGKGSEEIASDAIAAGVTDYLQKDPGTAQYELLANRVLNAAEKYRTDDRVRAQNRQYRRLFEDAPVMYAAFRDVDGEPVIGGCNDRFLERLGYERDAVVGRSVREFYDEESAELAVEGFRRAQEGEFSNRERTLVTAGGERVHTLLRASPRVDEYGETIGTVGLYVDITERKARERRLERLHEATREMFRSETREEVARAIAEAARETLDYPNNVVRLVDDEGEVLHPVAATDVAVDVMGPRPVYRVDGETPAAAAYRTGEHVNYEDVTDIDDRYDRGAAHAVMYVPIGDHGTISIADTDTGAFDGSDVELARILCTNAAAALDRLEWQRDLRRAERRFDALFEDPDSFLGVLDVDGTLLDANRRALEFVGAEREDVLGRPFPETPWWSHSADLRERLRGWIDRAADGEYVTFESPIRSADGAEIDVEGVIRPVTDEDGEVVSLVAEGRDVTERRERERELEYQGSLLEAVTETSLDGILVVNDDREVVLHNDRFVEMWDLPEDALESGAEEPILEAVLETVEAPDEVRERVDEFYADRDERGRARVELVDGRTLDCYTAPVAAEDRHYGRVWFFRDVTESVERERELERQNERLDGVIEVIAHDLRGPLNVAEGKLELARADADRGTDRLDEVADAHDRMEELIDDLLTWARHGETAEEVVPVDLADLVERCWRNLDAPDATLVVDTDLTVRADGTLLRRLVENLVRNAVEHGSADDRSEADDGVERSANDPSGTDEGTAGRAALDGSGDRDAGGVTVTVGDLDGQGFYVADDGPGIPPAERDRVFDPGRSTSADGTGFGLSIVRTVADAHGWTVDVTESEAGGARIEVRDVETA